MSDGNTLITININKNNRCETMDEKTRKLRSQSKLLMARIIIGKNGITEQTIKNIKGALKRESLIKIKILKTFLDEGEQDKKEIAAILAEKTNSALIDQVGFMIVLARK